MYRHLIGFSLFLCFTPSIYAQWDYDTFTGWAFSNSQLEFVPKEIPACNLDWGTSYQQCNSITSTQLPLGGGEFYAVPRTRCTYNRQSFDDVYSDKDRNNFYQLINWEQGEFTYEDSIWNEDPRVQEIEESCRVISMVDVGHLWRNLNADSTVHDSLKSGWPQLYNFNSSGYIRFTGWPPQTYGSSYRVALQNTWSGVEGLREVFPRVKEIFFHVDPNQQEVGTVTSIVDGEGFTAAAQFKLIPGGFSDGKFTPENLMEVTTKFFPRRNIDITVEKHTGVVGFSSMFWKDERDTPENIYDEAHDADMLVVGYDANGDGVVDQIVEHQIGEPGPAGDLANPDPDSNAVDRHYFDEYQYGNQVYFALENRDFNEANYAAYQAAEYTRRSSYSIQILETSIPLSAIMLEHNQKRLETDDNLVFMVAAYDHFYKANSLADSIRVKYNARAYFAYDSDNDQLKDQFERMIGTAVDNPDTDGDGVSDYQELLNRTDPKSSDNTVIPITAPPLQLPEPLEQVTNANRTSPEEEGLSFVEGRYTFSFAGQNYLFKTPLREVKIFDHKGSLIRDVSIVDGQAAWDRNNSSGSYVGSGLYLVKLVSHRKTVIEKLILSD